ncbi:hypothetical protein ABH929_000587 [Curtobacterium sp. AB7]
MAHLYLRPTAHHSAGVPRIGGHRTTITPTGHAGHVETRDPESDELAEETPPGWVLNTPNRLLEVWLYPVLELLLAAVHVALGIAFGGVFALVVGIAAAVVFGMGSVALLVTGWRAYDEQTRAASWRCHVTRVVVAVTSVAVVAVASLVVGTPSGLVFGAIAGIPMAFRFARVVPRIDHLVVAWASASVAVICTTLAVIGFTVPDLPEYRTVAWIGGSFFGLFGAVVAVHQFRAAARAPRDELELGLTAPDRTAS